MSTGQLVRPLYTPTHSTVRWRAWRFALLCFLLLCSLALTVFLRVISPVIDGPLQPFITLWFVSYLPYLGACLLVLATKPLVGRWRWIELGLVLFGAVMLRVILLPLPPNLSHDSWRYLWDARVTLHGYSPYIYVPRDPILQPLRNIVYANSRFRDVPTLYPPGAQSIYVLSYLIAPDNLSAFKGILMGLELVIIGAIAWLLHHKGLDPTRCLIYAWCPLPIVEFALQGHHEAITIFFTMLALVCAYGQWRGSRALTGFFLAMATLTNIYPIFFLLVMLRRRDWVLLFTCIVTIFCAYIPYILLGHGMVLGFFSTYASERTPTESIVPMGIHYISTLLDLAKTPTLILGYTADLIIIGAVSLLLWRLRRSERVSMELGILALTGTIFAVSSHIYPWYMTALLPWVALLIGPLWSRKKGWGLLELVLVIVWYCALSSITLYYFMNVVLDWSIYYLVVYAATSAGLAVIAFIFLLRFYDRKNKQNV